MFALITAQEREDAGEVQIEEADLVSDWAEPSHEVAASSVGVFDGDLLVGCAVPQGSAGDRLLATLAYRIRWTSWILQLPEGKQIPPRGLPSATPSARGIARALLIDSFDVARERGATVSELNADSRTGALSLYEKVGMVTTAVWVNRTIDLSSRGSVHPGRHVSRRYDDRKIRRGILRGLR